MHMHKGGKVQPSACHYLTSECWIVQWFSFSRQRGFFYGISYVRGSGLFGVYGKEKNWKEKKKETKNFGLQKFEILLLWGKGGSGGSDKTYEFNVFCNLWPCETLVLHILRDLKEKNISVMKAGSYAAEKREWNLSSDHTPKVHWTRSPSVALSLMPLHQ